MTPDQDSEAVCSTLRRMRLSVSRRSVAEVDMLARGCVAGGPHWKES